MHQHGNDSALRHLDFAIIDIIVMQFSFILTHMLCGHEGFIYLEPACRIRAIVFFSGQMALGLFSDAYAGILTRDTYEEFVVMLRYTFEIWLLCGVFLILANVPASPMVLWIVTLIYFDLGFLARQLNKKLHRIRKTDRRKVLLVTVSNQVRNVIKKVDESKESIDYQLNGVILLDDADERQFDDLGISILNINNPDLLNVVGKWWVDDLFFLGTEETTYPKKLMDDFLGMGFTIHYSISALEEFDYAQTDVQSLGDYKVITKSIHFASDRAVLIKRMMDIMGGLAGTIMTGIIFLFIAPIIYIKSPGPIFFCQKRIGENGKIFNLYKFRSMYMDAEKRKAELMAQNKLGDGKMFKMDDDPRIIGSEKKDKFGKPKGIGNFIRNTSLDEFPQFWNILKGDMSLVGTRPPTVDEWNQYDPNHRSRMACKPGLTGMWQVSGRSEITDFDQVVALDRKYIENWSVMLDIKILFRTVKVVLQHEGAS